MSDFAIFCLCATGAYVAHLFFRTISEARDYERRLDALEAAVFTDEENESHDGGVETTDNEKDGN